MREIKGYVCIASAPLRENRRFEYLYGRNSLAGGRSYGSFLDGGLLTFGSCNEAEKAARDIVLMVPEFNRAQAAHLQMKIADTEEEAERLFKKSRNLAVMVVMDHSHKLYGENIGGNLMTTFSGAYDLSLNGFRPFTSYGRAVDVARDARRQSECPAYVVSLQMRRV